MAGSVLDQDLGLLQGAEALAIQEFVPQFAIEGLTVPVLPGTPRLDEQGLHAEPVQPSPHRLGAEVVQKSTYRWPIFACSHLHVLSHSARH